MRRSDFDVTDRIRTTDPIEVGDEVKRLYLGLYPRGNSRPMARLLDGYQRSRKMGAPLRGAFSARLSAAHRMSGVRSYPEDLVIV